MGDMCSVGQARAGGVLETRGRGETEGVHRSQHVRPGTVCALESAHRLHRLHREPAIHALGGFLRLFLHPGHLQTGG